MDSGKWGFYCRFHVLPYTLLMGEKLEGAMMDEA
jgi:hypothetical protein